MFPTNHKTIFVLDHTPYFGISSDYPIDFDSSKSRGPGYVPLPPVCKSLWTCSVEAAVEYCRIVWDLFPEGKLVRKKFFYLSLCPLVFSLYILDTLVDIYMATILVL